MSDESKPPVDEATTPQGARPPLARTLAVPILLLAAIGGWAWLSWTAAPSVSPPPQTTTTNATSVAATDAPAEATVESAALLVGPATPWGAAGLEPATTAPPPVVAPAAPGAIGVFGPPAGSRFRAGDTVVFYWAWPEELAEGQRFVLYLVAAEERRPLGQVDEANLGRVYQVSALVGEAGDFRWEVVLEDGSTGAIIAASEPRAIITIDG